MEQETKLTPEQIKAHELMSFQRSQKAKKKKKKAEHNYGEPIVYPWRHRNAR